MFRPSISALEVWLALLCPLIPAQTGRGAARGDEGFTVRLPVDEVVLTFHATDQAGRAVRDLKKEEIRLRDNGRAPRRILALESLTDRPLRGAILLDTSESMGPVLARNRQIAVEAVGRLFDGKLDQGQVARFAFGSETMQAWTADSSSLLRGLGMVGAGAGNALHGTALFDAIFRTCFQGWGRLDPTATGNFILLFSDGEENASRVSADEALEACQRSNTAIFAFEEPPPPGRDSTGPGILHHLAERSGGRVFASDEGEDARRRDLDTVASEMRNQYRLVYNPAALEHDGSFHSIELQPPDRVHRIEVRSGYYAPGS